jgi:hypothetical protein
MTTRKSKDFSREFTIEEREKGLTNSLQGLSIDQINALQDIDYQYYNDLINCTFNSPFNNEEIMSNWRNVTSLIAFPNVL